jgi:hypothetical protein
MTTQYLTGKQFFQLHSIARETQSFLPHDEVSIIEMIKIAGLYCTSLNRDTKWLKEKIEMLKSKHYLNGFKSNKSFLPDNHFRKVMECSKPRFVAGLGAYKPAREIEKVAFVKSLRACRDYIRSNFTENAFSVFVERLDNIRLIVS